MLTVSEIEAAHRKLVAQGVDASEVFHCAEGTACRFPGIGVRVNGPQPEHLSYSSFVSFQDPDGNGWVSQEVTKRLPGRVAGGPTYSSVEDLAAAMIRAAKAQASMRSAMVANTIKTGLRGTPNTWRTNSLESRCRSNLFAQRSLSCVLISNRSIGSAYHQWNCDIFAISQR